MQSTPSRTFVYVGVICHGVLLMDLPEQGTLLGQMDASQWRTQSGTEGYAREGWGVTPGHRA